MAPSLNNWTTIFLLAAGQGLFLCLILLIANTRRKNFNWPIIVLIGFFSITLVHYVLYWSGYISKFPYLRFIPEIGFYLFGPLLLLYINRILLARKAGPAYLFLLSFSFWVFVLASIYWINKSLPFPIEQAPFTGRIFRLPLWPWLVALQMFVYNIIIYILIHRYKRNRDDELAAIRVRWSRSLNIFFSAFILAYSSYFFLVGFDFFEVGWDYMISAVMSLAIYGIGYMAFTQPQIFNGIFLQQIFVPKKYKSSQLTDSMADELFNKIQDYFISDEPYLNPELRQAHVCEKLSFTTHQISQVINQKTNATFSAFVKNYRLGYAENMIRENPEIDIKTVYYQSGFNNKTSFNSAFKQKLGITPSVFKERVQIENQKK